MSSSGTANACQYCGVQAKGLTIDHVLSRSRGGETTWDNVVTACRPCNAVKGDRTLAESEFRLLRSPVRPYFLLRHYAYSGQHQSTLSSWDKVSSSEAGPPTLTFPAADRYAPGPTPPAVREEPPPAMSEFQLVSDFQPTGDQPRAISELLAKYRFRYLPTGPSRGDGVR